MTKLSVVRFTICAAIGCCAYADQGGFFNSGGSLAGTTVTNPPGTLSISGANVAFVTTDGSTTMNATFTTSSTVESCSGGGRGGHVKCVYTLSGLFSGTLTVNNAVQAINGTTTQVYSTTGVVLAGATAYNSAYTPFYFSNTGQILRSDDLQGTHLISYGTQGSGTGQFYGAYSIALDSARRIYVADTYNGRIVRFDDMKGKNWTSYGTYGASTGQFNDPMGISVDSTGKIYVMDTGNSRLVRMDDMNGTNWTSMSALGSGTGQFAQYSTPVAFDSSGRIYIADTGNRRIVRMDDLNGTNWTTLTQSPDINGYIYSFGSPIGVALDAAGKIYVADTSQPSVIRVDDMTGANWTSVILGSGATPHSIAVDPNGMVLVGGGGVQTVDNMAGGLVSSNTLTQYYGPYYVFGATPIPQPSPLPAAMTFSPAALTFANQNIGTSSAAQPVTITNFGGSPLNLSAAANHGFVDTTDCPGSLFAGSNCTIFVSFAPSVTGPAHGTLKLTDNSGNLGAAQVVTLSGVATKPVAYTVPGSLVFPSQIINSSSAAQSVVVMNTGTGPMQVTGATVAAPFSQTNNCIANISPGAGCTVQVTFTPTSAGPAAGALTISTDAGTQTAGITGTGATVASTVTVSPAAVLFPPELLKTTSAPQTVTVANTGTTAVSIAGISVAGDFSKSTTCKASLASGKSCSITITFTPLASGTRTGTLTVNLPQGAQTVSLTGTGSTGSLPGALGLNPTAVSFPNYTIGDNPSQTVTVTNTSGAAAGIAKIAIVGATNLTERNKCPGVLAPGATCSITVTFTPHTYGTFTSTLTVTESSGAQDNVPVTGFSGPGS